MLQLLIFAFALGALLSVVRGDSDRYPGPVRRILVFTLVVGGPMAWVQFDASARKGERYAWASFPVYLTAAFLGGLALWLIERRNERRRKAERPNALDELA